MGLACFVVAPVVTASDRVDAVISFHDQATVEGAEIQLQHIASVRTADPKLARRLREFRIGAAPRDGSARVVQRRRVLSALSAARPALSVRAAGAEQTRVEARTRELGGERLLAAARARLEQHLRRERPELVRVAIEPVGEVAGVSVPAAAAVALEARIQGSGIGKRVCVWVDAKIDDTVYRRVPVWLDVRAYAPVLVAQRFFAPREPMQPGDFTREERDIADLREPAVSAPQAVAGKRARHYLAAGDVLAADDLEPVPPVAVAQEVDVRVAVGPVVIETRAVAEEEGEVGEYIRVRNPSSAATFIARVVGEQSVLVTPR